LTIASRDHARVLGPIGWEDDQLVKHLSGFASLVALTDRDNPLTATDDQSVRVPMGRPKFRRHWHRGQIWSILPKNPLGAKVHEPRDGCPVGPSGQPVFAPAVLMHTRPNRESFVGPVAHNATWRPFDEDDPSALCCAPFNPER